jgi:hypothetical protein
VEFRNDTGKTITAFSINYQGEQWRSGTSGRQDRLDFQYSLNAGSLTSGTWTDVDTLDFMAPDSSGTAGSRDGNAPSYRMLVSGTITGLSLSPGDTFWLRWVDFDASGADDGLAVDDFSLTAWGPAAGHAVNETGTTVSLCLTSLLGLGVLTRRHGRVRAA